MNHPKKSRHYHVISANSRVVRNINRSVILNFIRERQPISRVAIAGLARLNKSTVSSIVTSLLNEDLVVEEHGRARTEGRNSVGRSPINLRLKKGRNLVGAISFDPATTRLAVVDVDGSIVDSDEIKTIGHPTEEFVSFCAERLLAIRAGHHLPHLKGIGVSVAGIVDSTQAKVVVAPNLGWEDLNIGEIVKNTCPAAEIVAVENDAKAAALAELWFGHYEINLVNFVFLSVGRGIGTGIVIDKRILTGESNLAGEFGHTVLIEGGEPCACGNRGCWEAYASDLATVQRYTLAKSNNGGGAGAVTIDDVIASARSMDIVARQELKRTGQYLGIGIANIIKAVDPDAIIVGGHIRAAWDLIAPDIMEAVRKRAFFGKPSGTLILPTSLTVRPSLLGAAAMAQRRLFSDVRVTL
jgi:predicted NBD/HSP70 family sugar kinase